MSCRVSIKTLQALEKDLEGHQIKILSLIYSRYFENKDINYEDFIKEFSNKEISIK